MSSAINNWLFLWRLGNKILTAPPAHAPKISQQLCVSVGATYLGKVLLKISKGSDSRPASSLAPDWTVKLGTCHYSL